jgi:hypothetical protein
LAAAAAVAVGEATVALVLALVAIEPTFLGQHQVAIQRLNLP